MLLMLIQLEKDLLNVKEYINKFKTLTDGIIFKKRVQNRFLKCVQNLPNLKAKESK